MQEMVEFVQPKRSLTGHIISPSTPLIKAAPQKCLDISQVLHCASAISKLLNTRMPYLHARASTVLGT